MKTIFYIDVADVQFFFDEDGNLLQWWDANDANYRSEYMNPLFKALDIDIKDGDPSDISFRDTIAEVLENCGLDEDEITELLK